MFFVNFQLWSFKQGSWQKKLVWFLIVLFVPGQPIYDFRRAKGLWVQFPDMKLNNSLFVFFMPWNSTIKKLLFSQESLVEAEANSFFGLMASFDDSATSLLISLLKTPQFNFKTWNPQLKICLFHRNLWLRLRPTAFLIWWPPLMTVQPIKDFWVWYITYAPLI